MRLMGKYVSKPIQCVACAAASKTQREYTSQPHDEDGIHYVIQERV